MSGAQAAANYALRVTGIGRDRDVPKGVIVYFDTRPTDDDMRRIQNLLQDGALGAIPVPPLDDQVRAILGRLCFTCVHIAQLLRAGGMEIARKAEDEQAAVIHWLLTKYAQYGLTEWVAKANDELAAIASALPRKSAIPEQP